MVEDDSEVEALESIFGDDLSIIKRYTLYTFFCSQSSFICIINSYWNEGSDPENSWRG